MKWPGGTPKSMNNDFTAHLRGTAQVTWGEEDEQRGLIKRGNGITRHIRIYEMPDRRRPRKGMDRS